MSFLFEGVRWKADAPRHIRLSHNLESYDTRATGAARTLQKLAEKGFFKVTPITPVSDRLSADGPCPILYLPVFVIPLGGTDKPDKPGEIRIVGD